MIHIGTHTYYEATDIGQAAPPKVYRSESLITRAAKASLDPIECPDCGHRVTDHHPDYRDAGCCTPGCICTLTQTDLSTDQEGTDQ